MNDQQNTFEKNATANSELDDMFSLSIPSDAKLIVA
jgi:hypothetical protein